MKNYIKSITILSILLAFFSCDQPETSQELFQDDVDPNAPYYFQFANASKKLETGVSPEGSLVDIETSIDAVLLGSPLNEDVVIPFAVNSATTITSDQYELSADAITIPKGQTSGSITLKSVVENMTAGQKEYLVLDLDAGANNATAGTQLSYEMLRIVYCPPISGTWTIDGQDAYGDGWNDAAVSVNINDTVTDYTITDGSSESWDIDVPSTTTKLKFAFISGAWDEEVTFQITDPDGNVVISTGPTPTPGDLGYDPCDWED